MPGETQSITDRIKQQLDLVEQIGAVVPLRQAGKAYKGLCPFHGERTASFYVLPERGVWKCFGCGEGGDLFTFVMKQQGLDFREALALLAERAGIALEGPGGDARGGADAADARQRLRALNDAAAIWFHTQLLQAPEASYARSYLESRGVNNDALTLWRLGYAPDGDALTRYLLAQGYTAEELVAAGLARAREAERGGGLYDSFRNRVIFPIRDGHGHTIGFGGRELAGGQPKYLNTPQTLLFDKSATLFGLDLARDAIRRQDRVIIVEGYMDAIVAHEHGSRNVVACIGSAITEKHIQQIKKLTHRVTLCLDPDAAGGSATLRGITVAQQAFDRVAVPVAGPAPERPDARGGRERAGRVVAPPRGIVRLEEQVDAAITVMRLPPHEDPDEFIRRDPAAWQRAIAEAQPLIDFLIAAQTADLALDTAQGKLEACRRLLPVIADVRDRLLSAHYVDRLAARLRLDVTELQRDLQRARARLDREARASRARQVSPSASPGDGAPLGEKSQPVAEPEAEGGRADDGPLSAGGVVGELVAEQAQAEYCLGVLLRHPRMWTEAQAVLSERDFASAEARALYPLLGAAIRADGYTPQGFIAELLPELRVVAERAWRRAMAAADLEGSALTKAAGDAAYRLKRMRLKADLAELDYLQRDAEQAGDHETLDALRRQTSHLLLQRRTIDRATKLSG